MIAPLLVFAFHFAPIAEQEPDVFELRKALDSLRAGHPGEPPFDAAVRYLPDLIKSGSTWFVAGGAYIAGQHGREECVPALIAALGREHQRLAGPDHEAKRSILDALIRLDATAPVDLLTQRLEQSSLAETFLLLVRAPEGASDGLLALFDASPLDARARWAAACALVEARDKRIAARCLAGMVWEIDVLVRDAGSSITLGDGIGSGRWGSAHERWPPRFEYELLLPAEGAPLVPIGHVRTEETRSGRLPAAVMRDERTAMRVRLFDALLGGAEERGVLHASEDLSIDWTSADDYANALREHCRSLRERLERVAVRLEALGYLERAAEVCSRLELHVRVHDLRLAPAEALAEPPMPGVVYERS